MVGEGKKKPEFVMFPGYNGIPVRGLDPGDVLTEDEMRRLVPVWDMHVQVFDLEDEEDQQDYERLMTMAASYRQHVQIGWEKPCEGFGKESWKIAVKWGERYLQKPMLRGVYSANKNPLGA